MFEFRSTSWVPAVLYACLKEADHKLGADREWQGSSRQDTFLGDYEAGLADLKLLKPEEFKAKLSEDAHVLNRWVAANGFNITFDPFPPGCFGTAAIVRKSAKWKAEGTPDRATLEDGSDYPIVRMEKESFDAFVSKKHPHPVARISGEDGSEWHLTKAHRPLEGVSLFSYVQDVNGSLRPSRADKLLFPKVDFEESVDRDLVVGLYTFDLRGRRWNVTQCKQETRIKLNEKGGLAESAGTMGFECLLVREDVVIAIDGPFILWIRQPGMRLPLFAAQFGFDVFKDPGEIAFGKPVTE